MIEMEAKNITELNAEQLLNELAFVNKMSKFYYARKEEIMKEIERRELNGKANV